MCRLARVSLQLTQNHTQHGSNTAKTSYRTFEPPRVTMGEILSPLYMWSIVPFLGGQVLGFDHPHREDVLQTTAVILVGVDGSPQVLHPFVPLCCRATGEALCPCRGRYLGDEGLEVKAWVCVGCILGACWVCSGCMLSACWVCWECVGCLFVMCWVCVGCVEMNGV